MPGTIPVRNLYYLLLYAWNRLPEGRVVDVSGTGGPELPNLLSKVLLEGTYQLIRRGVDRGYIAVDADLTRPRGRICIGDTISRGLLSRVQLACNSDELSHDVLHNRILKATLVHLSRTKEVEGYLREQLDALASRLSDVQYTPVFSADFSRVQLHANNALYGLLLSVCALVHEALMPEKGRGRFRFRDVLADPQTMGRIFQDFVYNFYRLEQNQFAVRSASFPWMLSPDGGHGHQLIPRMQTDVSLQAPHRTIVIECKWASQTLESRFGRNTLCSEHLYQLFAYLKNLPSSVHGATSAEGILLYPLQSDEVDVAFSVNGHRIRARTVDLRPDWGEIHSQLMALIG
jgi:5-methylcytosine-specific restriction enzyme subunit McrC